VAFVKRDVPSRLPFDGKRQKEFRRRWIILTRKHVNSQTVIYDLCQSYPAVAVARSIRPQHLTPQNKFN
jgi:hypothetical protein